MAGQHVDQRLRFVIASLAALPSIIALAGGLAPLAIPPCDDGATAQEAQAADTKQCRQPGGPGAMMAAAMAVTVVGGAFAFFGTLQTSLGFYSASAGAYVLGSILGRLSVFAALPTAGLLILGVAARAIALPALHPTGSRRLALALLASAAIVVVTNLVYYKDFVGWLWPAVWGLSGLLLWGARPNGRAEQVRTAEF